MPTADPAAQRAVLELAEVDRAIDNARHRRSGLPELALIADADTRIREVTDRAVLARTDVDDLARAGRKLDDEIDGVRARAERDQQRLATGAVPPKELENLQREIESLARRQHTLEEEALELMERREEADTALAALEEQRRTLHTDLDTATASRDQQWRAIDTELAELTERRAALTGQIPADVLAIYDRLRAADRVAAGELVGDRCTACQISIDRTSLDGIQAAPAEVVQRCPECGAILVRG